MHHGLRGMDAPEWINWISVRLTAVYSKMLLLKPWYRENDTEERNEAARKSYETLLTITLKQPESAGAYAKFSEAVKKRAKLLFKEPVFAEDEEVFVYRRCHH